MRLTRQFTCALGLLGTNQLLRAQPAGFLPPECLAKGASGRLDIDVHTHVFNGSDLQVEKFLSSVVSRHYPFFLRKVIQALAKPLQRSVWKRAPQATDELKKLARFGEGPAIKSINNGQLAEVYADAVQETDMTYSQGFAEELKTPDGQQFLDAYREYLSDVAARDPKAADAIRAISPIPELERLRNPEELLKQLDREKALSDYSVASVFGFIRSFYAYRFEHVYYLLHNYGCEHGTVQLIAAALVDYDYPLGAGKTPPPSLLPEQFKVMARISEVFSGRVLTYLPFDPWRVVFEGSGIFNAVTDYITHGAAAGVKLYPPMGFAPLGNGDLKPPPPSWPKQPADFAAQLDRALVQLWEFAKASDVPVIAHAARSNAPADDRAGLGCPDHWQRVFDNYPNARVCFGHFGGEDLLKSKDSWPQGFLDLVSRYPNAYGDIAYFEEVLERKKEPALARRLSDFLVASKQAGNKMIYGSDWEMLGIEAHSEQYFQQFTTLFADPKLFKPDIPPHVLSQNAVDFLGLHPKQQTRSRLHDFYSKRSVNASWLAHI